VVQKLIFSCLLLLSFFGFAQQKNQDSLQIRLLEAKNSKDSSFIIREFIKENQNQNQEKAFTLLRMAENLIKKDSDKQLWADYYLDAGEIYFNYQKADKALENYIRSYNYYKSTDSENKYLIETRFAQIYLYTGYYEKAEPYMKKMYEEAIAQKDGAEIAKNETKLGRLYLAMFVEKDDNTKLEPALHYLRKAYKWIDKNGDDLTKMKLNIAMADAIGFTEGRDSAYHYYYAKAMKLADTSKNISEKSKAFAYNQYARYLFDIGRPDLAVENAEKAFQIVKDYNSFEKLDVAKTLYRSYIENKDYEKAATFFEKYTDLQDSLGQIEQYANINTLIHQQENPRKPSWIEKYWGWLLLSVMVVFSLIFVFVKIIQKRKLMEAQNELNQLMQKVAMLNSDIFRYEKEISRLKNSSNETIAEVEAKESHLKDILETPLLTDEQWLSFKRSFERVNTGYSKKISEYFSNISQAELRYLYLIKLGMSHKEIASVLGISPDSVRLYKHRLGKKINPGKEDVLPVLFEIN